MSDSDGEWKKIKQDRGIECDWNGTPDRIGMESFSDEMTFKQDWRKSEDEPCMYVGERAPGRGNSNWKVSEGEACLAHSKKSKKTMCLEHSEQGGKWQELKLQNRQPPNHIDYSKKLSFTQSERRRH